MSEIGHLISAFTSSAQVVTSKLFKSCVGETTASQMFYDYTNDDDFPDITGDYHQIWNDTSQVLKYNQYPYFSGGVAGSYEAGNVEDLYDNEEDRWADILVDQHIYLHNDAHIDNRFQVVQAGDVVCLNPWWYTRFDTTLNLNSVVGKVDTVIQNVGPITLEENPLVGLCVEFDVNFRIKGNNKIHYIRYSVDLDSNNTTTPTPHALCSSDYPQNLLKYSASSPNYITQVWVNNVQLGSKSYGQELYYIPSSGTNIVTPASAMPINMGVSSFRYLPRLKAPANGDIYGGTAAYSTYDTWARKHGLAGYATGDRFLSKSAAPDTNITIGTQLITDREILDKNSRIGTTSNYTANQNITLYPLGADITIVVENNKYLLRVYYDVEYNSLCSGYDDFELYVYAINGANGVATTILNEYHYVAEVSNGPFTGRHYAAVPYISGACVYTARIVSSGYGAKTVNIGNSPLVSSTSSMTLGAYFSYVQAGPTVYIFTKNSISGYYQVYTNTIMFEVFDQTRSVQYADFYDSLSFYLTRENVGEFTLYKDDGWAGNIYTDWNIHIFNDAGGITFNDGRKLVVTVLVGPADGTPGDSYNTGTVQTYEINTYGVHNIIDNLPISDGYNVRYEIHLNYTT